MDRRQFLQTSVGASLFGGLLAEAPFAQGPAPAAPAAPPPNPFPAPPVTRRLILDANSRNLQWMRTADDVSKAAIELTCGGVAVHVKPYPAHVDPAAVKQDLPAFVSRLRAAGLRVAQVKGPDLTNPDDPMVETIVGTAAQAGCTHYSLGSFTYDAAKPMIAQLEALKPRIAKFVRLNEKHKMTLTLDTVPNTVGAGVWDLLYVIKEFDPRYVGFHWDTGYMALHGDGTWEMLMRTAGPYVAAISWRDREWQQDLGLKGEGGSFPGPVARAGGAGGRGGAPGAGPARGAAPGVGRGAPGRAGDPAELPEGEVPPPARAGGGGRGAPNLEMPHRPLSGLIARGNGWNAPMVAMGTGIVDIVRIAGVLKDINFTGPSELASEYSTMGGADTGADKIALPRQFVIGLMKRDVLTIRKAFEMAANGLAI